MSPKYLPRGPLAGGFLRSMGRTIVYGTLEYCLSLPGLPGQARIRGGWREVEWQKASVLELVGGKESVEKRRERGQYSLGYVENQ